MRRVGMPLSAEFAEQRGKLSDNTSMARAVCRGDAIPILQVGPVVTHLRPKKIGESPAGLLEDHLWSTSVPKFCPRTWMNIQVARLRSNEGNFKTDRTATLDTFD